MPHAKYQCIFKVVVHEKKIFKGFCYIYSYTTIPPEGVAIYNPRNVLEQTSISWS